MKLPMLITIVLSIHACSSSIVPVLSNIKPPIETALDGLSVTPQVLQNFVQPLEVQLARNSYVYRQGTGLRLNGAQWTASGANAYWLGGDENMQPPPGEPFYAPLNASYPTFRRITEAMNTLATMGARTIRSQTLGVSMGNPLSLMPEVGVYNANAFDTIDWAVFQARQVNPLVQQFYTNSTIMEDFKDYIMHLITHVNPYTGLTYADDPTIFAYETANELCGPVFGDMDVPVSWTAEISAYIKTLAPHKLIVDGTCGINKTHLSIPTIDIYSDHFYPANNTKLTADISLVASAQKVYLVGEYDWTANNLQRSDLQSFFDIIEPR